MKRVAALATLCLIAAAPLARAEEEQSCMAATPITAGLVAEAGQSGWRGAEAHGAAPAFLVGALSYLRDNQELAGGAHGGVAFIRGADRTWRAMLPARDESIIAAFYAPATGALIFVTQVQTEGPGQSWTLARINADGAASCVTVPFPDALNKPDWANETLELFDLDIKANGRGELLGSADVERNGAPAQLNFVYRTRDGGASWGAAQRLGHLRLPPPGLYERMEEAPAAQTLISALAGFSVKE